MNRRKIVICTTVPETLLLILKGQPRFLSQHFDVAIITSGGRKEACKISEVEGVPVYNLPMKRGISPLADCLSMAKMYFLLRRLKPDAIHSYTPKAGLICMVSGWAARVPLRIHTFTGLVYSSKSGIKKSILVFVDKVMAFFSTNLVPEGNGVRDELIGNGVTGKPLNVIGNGNVAGVDVEEFCKKPMYNSFFQEVLGEFGVPEDTFKFCYIGRLNVDKGVGDLISAFSRLDDGCSLVIVGSLDSENPISQDVFDSIEKDRRIFWLGFSDDVPRILSCIDVLVLPSYREGFPNVVLQAGACQVPVIASNINGSNEIVSHGVNGWLFTPRSVDELTATMTKARLSDEKSRKEMGLAARGRVVTLYSRDMYLKKLLEFYNSIF